MARRTRPRRLRASQLPYIVRRRWWASAITLLLVPFLAGLASLMIVFSWTAEAEWTGKILGSLCGTIFLFGSVVALDRSIPYHVRIESDGLVIHGLLFRRHFHWAEIVSFDARPNFRLPGYYASFKVDGSHHPRRHWSSLWFGFYDIPPLMEFGGKDLTALLRHAKRRAEAGWAI